MSALPRRSSLSWASSNVRSKESTSESMQTEDDASRSVIHVELDHDPERSVDTNGYRSLPDAVRAGGQPYIVRHTTPPFSPPTQAQSPSAYPCVCGTRRLCVRCITQAANQYDGGPVSPSQIRIDAHDKPRSEPHPPITFINDDVSDIDMSDEAARSSAEESSDVGIADNWQEARMCLWGDGRCNHRFILPRSHGQNPLVTIIRKHLQKSHPEIFTTDAKGKYICQWDGCRDPLASVTSVARHILTGRKHMDCGMPCPDCHEGSFRMDSLKLHRERCRVRKNRKVKFFNSCFTNRWLMICMFLKE